MDNYVQQVSKQEHCPEYKKWVPELDEETGWCKRRAQSYEIISVTS